MRSGCCLDREESRRDNDYREADQIRDQLTSIGIQLDDKTHTFTMQDGQRGSYDLHYVAPAGPSASWVPSAPPRPLPHRGALAAPARDGGFAGIQQQCLERERARRDGDYKTADRLRDHLGSLGVQLEDKTHIFTTPDGRTGTYDLHQYESGASQQAPPPPPHYAQHFYAQAHYPPQYMQPQYPQMQPQYMQPHHGQVRQALQAPSPRDSAYASPRPSATGSSGYSGYLDASSPRVGVRKLGETATTGRPTDCVTI